MKIIKIFSIIVVLNLSGQAYSMGTKCLAACIMATATQTEFWDDFLTAIKLRDPASSNSLPLTLPSFFRETVTEKECPPCFCRCNMGPAEVQVRLTNEQMDVKAPACRISETEEIECEN